MKIDQIVPLVEQVVLQNGEGRGSFFSYRHAEEIHALGLKHEFPSDYQWSQVCISIVVSTVFTPKIWARILWSRQKPEYPKEESTPWEFPLSEVGVHMFAKEWPAIRKLLEQAIARGIPPETALQK
jgi:hypothetical protein